MLSRSIDESLAHLRPWMTWALHEPVSFERRVERLRTHRGHFDLGSDYTYGIFDKEETVLLGVVALKLGSDVEERELGYWIHAAHTRRGLAVEASLAVIKMGFDVEALSAIELRTDPANEASARVAEKLGFEGPELDPLSYPTPEGKRDTHVYTLSRVRYATSAARSTVIALYDVLDREI